MLFVSWSSFRKACLYKILNREELNPESSPVTKMSPSDSVNFRQQLPRLWSSAPASWQCPWSVCGSEQLTSLGMQMPPSECDLSLEMLWYRGSLSPAEAGAVGVHREGGSSLHQEFLVVLWGLPFQTFDLQRNVACSLTSTWLFKAAELIFWADEQRAVA